jgi:hypothetical protein
MARGGRRQPRDARGRFSSTGATARGGRLSTASGKRRATVTAKAKGQAPTGTISKRRGKPSAPTAPVKPAAVNGIRKYQPLTLAGWDAKDSRQVRRPTNRIRPYSPATNRGKGDQIDRQINTTVKGITNELRSISDKVKKAKPAINQLRNRIQRDNARAIANRLSSSSAKRFVAGIELNTIGGRSGAKAIQRRAARASAAAARGSKPAQRAQQIYANQLAFTGPGKPKAAKSNLRPGPRNTQGPPKRTRKPRRKK